MAQTQSEFVIYQARIGVTVSRKVGPYSSDDTLATFTLDEQFPLPTDVKLENVMEAFNARLDEVGRKIENVLLARGEFERRVQLAIGSGDVDNVFGE